MAYGNPTDTQINTSNTSPAAKVGDVRTARGLDGYIWATGILSPEVSNYLSWKFPQYYATAILERFGNYSPVAQDIYSWFEQDRTRLGATVTAGGGVTTATATFTLDIPAASAGEGYFMVKDIIRLPSGKNAKVTAVGASGGFQTITVAKTDGTNFLVTDIAASGDRIGHLSNSFEEFSDAPTGRRFTPDQRKNRLSILRRSSAISGTAMTDRTYLSDGRSWMYTQEEIDSKEFAKDRENTVMFGEYSDTALTTEGINTSVWNLGVKSEFTGAVTESDLQNLITTLKVSSSATEYLVLAGAEYMGDMQKALRDYAISGGVTYGSFSGVKMVGINFQSYMFNGTTLNFVHYNGFDDSASLPTVTAPSATRINYSNYSLWLNVGQGSQKNIELKYKELQGEQRKLIIKHENGMMGDGNMASNGKDGKYTHFLSDIGVKMTNMNQHAVHRANG